ncbi:hypothetical protein BJV77DRAFT_989819 [Russula vinacea]|nr:hypothetical protein BJV77DRAFT_989819 [Russula vinacea]
MLTKLDSLHLLTEWQFHNVNRASTLVISSAYRISHDSGLNQLATIPRPTRIGSLAVCSS